MIIKKCSGCGIELQFEDKIRKGMFRRRSLLRRIIYFVRDVLKLRIMGRIL